MFVVESEGKCPWWLQPCATPDGQQILQEQLFINTKEEEKLFSANPEASWPKESILKVLVQHPKRPLVGFL